MTLIQTLWIVVVVLLAAIGWLRYKVGASSKWWHGSLSWELDGWYAVFAVAYAAAAYGSTCIGYNFMPLLLAVPMLVAVCLLAEHLGKLHPLPDPDPRPAGV